MGALTEPPFHTLAIAGLGLIGGSIALAVRERWPSIRIAGVDRPPVLAHALGSGAIDRAATSVADVGPVDLVILAAPVRQNIALLRQLADHYRTTRDAARTLSSLDSARDDRELAEGAGPRGEPDKPRFTGAVAASMIVTDVGGTKRDIVEAARGLDAGFTFIGGHPIGGAERGGFGFARPDLFAGRPWILTPDEGSPVNALSLVERFAAGLDARPSTLSAVEHDRLMAYVSHLPQLTASALMSVVGEGAADGLRLAGRGLVDTTRLASSPASVWRDISASNGDFIGEALDGLIATLTQLRGDLQRGQALEKTFDAAGRWRAELMKGRD